jgi:protein involved in polysaccharide export with SLBB domain
LAWASGVRAADYETNEPPAHGQSTYQPPHTGAPGGAEPQTAQELLTNPSGMTYQQGATQVNPFGQPGDLSPGQATAQPFPGSSPVEGGPGSGAASGHTTPQGPELAPGAMPVQGLVAYKPIDESMLPKGAAISAQAPNATHANLPSSTNLGAPAINWGPYTLGPDDVVHIAVRNQREFTGVYAIGRDGKIQFGFIGDIDANGLTKEELARKVEEALKRYVRVPSVHVTIIGFNSKAIYILGRVARPGKYAMRGDSIKIRDAVIAAGLVVQHAKLRKVHIVKSDRAKPTYKIVDLQRVLYKGKMEQNVDLVHGDIVVIPTTVWGGINDFLTGLLSPTGHAGSVAALAAL